MQSCDVAYESNVRSRLESWLLHVTRDRAQCELSLTAKGQLITVNSSRKISSYCFGVFIVKRNDTINADCLFSFAIESSSTSKRCLVLCSFNAQGKESLIWMFTTVHKHCHSLQKLTSNTYRILVHFPIEHLRILSTAEVMSIGSDNRNPKWAIPTFSQFTTLSFHLHIQFTLYPFKINSFCTIKLFFQRSCALHMFTFGAN